MTGLKQVLAASAACVVLAGTASAQEQNNAPEFTTDEMAVFSLLREFDACSVSYTFDECIQRLDINEEEVDQKLEDMINKHGIGAMLDALNTMTP